MIAIELPTGEVATVDDGVWTVRENDELTRLFNSPAMQPPDNGYYAPSENARKADHILKVWGGTFRMSDEYAEPGKLY